jgi:hypothetical protein
MSTIKRKLALTFAVALAAVAVSATSAQATYYVFIDPDTGRPCTDVVEQGNGSLSGGCVIRMTAEERPVYLGGAGCGFDFDLRIGSRQGPVLANPNEYGVYLDNFDVVSYSTGCIWMGEPISNWGGGDSWRARIKLDMGDTMAGGHELTMNGVFSGGRSEQVVMHITGDDGTGGMKLSNEIRAVQNPSGPDARWFHKGQWTSSDGVRMYTLQPIDFDFAQP